MTLPIEIDVHSVSQLRKDQQPFFFLDCREQEEYAVASIDGAQLIPMSQLRERLEELEPHRGERIIIHCHHGMRSLQVAGALRQMGYENAQSMAGGIDAWSEQIDPAMPRY